MSAARWQWYARRLGRMSPREVGSRAVDHARQRLWSLRPLWSGALTPPFPAPKTEGWRIAARADLSALDPDSVAGVLQAADRLLAGEWELLGAVRTDMVDPDWSKDASGGSGFPSGRNSFRIDYRSCKYGNVKQVWELSRHHHLTVLACAWRLTGDERYAEMAARHLRSWWSANRFLLGVNWSSGIELGIRLISWVWIRRLLDDWPGVAELFEHNDDAVRQIYWHQRYLAAFPSRGSSANNHVIAELAGLLIGSCGFGWFGESAGWRSGALAGLRDELEKNTFASGVNRELASDYHGFVAELGVLAAAEATAAGLVVPPEISDLLCAMVDVIAAVVDEGLRAPRQGDGDDGRALVLSDPADNRWRSLLGTGAAIFGPLPWWPHTEADVTSTLVFGLMEGRLAVGPRPQRRPLHFPDAGLTILRTGPGSGRGRDPEIWCRCDGGPHGFGSLAAHGHADALSVEVRCGGVDVLADPGTYCYHEEPEWRGYFRSTRAHNTLAIEDQDQSVSGGPFMWSRHANTRVLEFADMGANQRWSAEHDGYQRLDPPACHRRTVTLDAQSRRLEIVDRVETSKAQSVRLTFQLGPAIRARLVDLQAELEWVTSLGGTGRAVLHLPADLAWSLHRGEHDPIIGWYSPSFGTKVAAPAIVGFGEVEAIELRTRLDFVMPQPTPLGRPDGSR